MNFKAKLLIFLLLFFSIAHSNSKAQDYVIYFLDLYDYRFSFPLRDLDFLGGGARARAMGGAFWAVSDDASAGSWNPAGLVQLDKIQTSFSFLSFSYSSFHS